MPKHLSAGIALSAYAIALAWLPAALANAGPVAPGRIEAPVRWPPLERALAAPHDPLDVHESAMGLEPTPAPLSVAHLWEIALKPPDRLHSEPAYYDGFGWSLASAGDVNGDGFPDLIVGAPGDDATGEYRGAAYLWFGGASMRAGPDRVLASTQYAEGFGGSVASAGDFNGDGFADIIVGAPGISVGAAYLFFGGANPDTSADLVLHGEGSGGAFGVSVASAGDVNGDGFADVIVGASTENAGGSNSVGRAYVYLGGPAADAAADLVLSGNATGDRFGVSVASAGDLNGDGNADLIVGAPGDDAAGADAGRAYVYLGGPVPDALADLVLTGEAAGDAFGWSVASTRDMNGDGHSDVVVGAPDNGAGGVIAGRAYVYFGGAAADAAPDVVFTGFGAYYRFGNAVAPAGDVNGDGFADLIVGDYHYDYDDTGDPRLGAYVFLGGPTVDHAADLVMHGWYFFGNSVASAGDVHGDGFDDLLIGDGDRMQGPNELKRFALLCDFNRYHVQSPNGSEVWNVGASQTLSWLGPERADVLLSQDGGTNYELLLHDVGGAASNTASLQVPRAATTRARIKVTPADASVRGHDESQAPFVIRNTVAVQGLTAVLRGHQVELSWSSEPDVGPTGIAGYRLYRGAGGEPPEGTRIGPALITEPRFTDPTGTRGHFYRLVAVNGFGDELALGRLGLDPGAPLAVWPLPYRGGTMYLSFTLPGVGPNPSARADVELFDIGGRLVRTLAHGNFAGSFQSIPWDGRDAQGHPVRDGIYFVRAVIAGASHHVKVVVTR